MTVAREALVVPDVKNDRLELTLRDMGTHASPYHEIAPTGATALKQEPSKKQEAKPYSEMLTNELRAFIRKTPKKTQEGTDSRIELQRRFSLPVACLMLAMVGIPLGTSSRKGGRSAGYIWAIFLAFFCYYLSYITLTSLARSRSISVESASWLPNAGFAIAGIVMIARMESPGDRDFLGAVRQTITAWFAARDGQPVAIDLHRRKTHARWPSSPE